MRTKVLPRLPGILELLALSVGLSKIILILFQHWAFVSYPACQEVNENTVWYHTWLLFNGHNSFNVAEMPTAAYCFSPLYNYVVLLFSPILGISYSAHRFLNLLCIFGVFWVMAREMRRLGAGWGFVALAVALTYCEIFRNLMITSRPDAMGWFIYMWALVIPWRRGFSVGSSAVGLCLCLIAFFFKSYFLVGISLILLGVWARHGRRPAISLGVCTVLCLIFSCFLAAFLWPTFWVQSFCMQLICVRLNSHGWIAWLRVQELVAWTWPCLVLLSVGAVYWLVRQRLEGVRDLLRRLWLGARLDRSETLVVVSLYLVFLMLLVNGYLGQNGGACFTYQLHLLMPLIFIMSAPLVRRLWILVLLLGGMCLILWTDDWYGGYPTDPAPYHHMQEVMATCQNPYVSPLIIDVALDHNKRVYQTGNTLLVPMAFCEDWERRFKVSTDIQEVWERQRDEVLAAVRQKKFDVLLIQEGMADAFLEEEFVKTHYRVREKLLYPMAWGVDVNVNVWVPRAE